MENIVLLIGPFRNEAQQFLTGFQSEFEISHALTAEEGLAFIERNLKRHCITVMLDLYVEDQDGFDVLETIKAKYPIIEVITLSPDYRVEWAIETMRLGGYACESYTTSPSVIICYLSQLSSQFDLFKTAEMVCRKKMIKEMDVRLNLALEFLLHRRFAGATLDKDELSVFFPIQNEDSPEQILHQKLCKLDLKQPARILLVEDDLDLSNTLNAILVGLFNHQVTTVDTLAKAHTVLAQDHPFHVAILDIGLPDGEGTQLIGPILSQSPTTEIIMLTAYDDIDHVTKSFNLGAADYVPKPFDSYHLQQVVSKAAQRFIYKSFLPHTSWVPIEVDQTAFEIRLNLFEELIVLRDQHQKPIHVRELGVFLPSFRNMISSPLEWIETDSFKNGIAPVLLALAQNHKIRVSKEEMSVLERA